MDLSNEKMKLTRIEHKTFTVEDVRKCYNKFNRSEPNVLIAVSASKNNWSDCRHDSRKFRWSEHEYIARSWRVWNRSFLKPCIDCINYRNFDNTFTRDVGKSNDRARANAEARIFSSKSFKNRLDVEQLSKTKGVAGMAPANFLLRRRSNKYVRWNIWIASIFQPRQRRQYRVRAFFFPAGKNISVAYSRAYSWFNCRRARVYFVSRLSRRCAAVRTFLTRFNGFETAPASNAISVLV